MTNNLDRVKEILALVKPLAAEYYRLTGRPLGVTGEVAEYIVAEKLGLDLAPPRTAGYDAVRNTSEGPERIQIKGRAFTQGSTKSQRLGRIKLDAACDFVLLVLLDNSTLDPREMWEAPYSAVATRLAVPGSKARNDKGALSVAEFKKLATRVWVDPQGSIARSISASATRNSPSPARRRTCEPVYLTQSRDLVAETVIGESTLAERKEP